MTFAEIMGLLSKMYNTTCWLSKPQRSLRGESPAALLRRGENDLVSKVLKKEPRYKVIHARESRQPNT